MNTVSKLIKEINESLTENQLENSLRKSVKHLKKLSIENYIKFLKENEHTDVKIFTETNTWAAIYKFIFTHAILFGNIGDRIGYSDRWCYHTYEDALKALQEWSGKGEPEGWHRHPLSGRHKPADNIYE